jgi:hypothetical protein
VASDSGLQDSVERARQAFRLSAEGREAVHRTLADQASEAAAQRRLLDPAAEQDEPSHLHPFFRGLIDSLPEPGTPWPQAQRELWLETARHILALVYGDAEREPVRLQDHQPRPPMPPFEQRGA